jgi:hypothetical protein
MPIDPCYQSILYDYTYSDYLEADADVDLEYTTLNNWPGSLVDMDSFFETYAVN